MVEVDLKNLFQKKSKKNVTQEINRDYTSDKHKNKNLKTSENDPKKFFEKIAKKNVTRKSFRDYRDDNTSKTVPTQQIIA